MVVYAKDSYRTLEGMVHKNRPYDDTDAVVKKHPDLFFTDEEYAADQKQRHPKSSAETRTRKRRSKKKTKKK